jgi:hypothetical protein
MAGGKAAEITEDLNEWKAPCGLEGSDKSLRLKGGDKSPQSGDGALKGTHAVGRQSPGASRNGEGGFSTRHLSILNMAGIIPAFHNLKALPHPQRSNAPQLMNQPLMPFA